MTDFSKRIPLARDSTRDAPRSVWDKMVMEEQGMSGKSYAPPTSVKVDPSCYGIPGVNDPSVQQAALEAMRRSVDYAPDQPAEHGFFSSPDLIGGGHSAGPIFTDGKAHSITGDTILRNRSGFWESILNGTREPDLFVHTHPNYDPPSPVGKNMIPKQLINWASRSLLSIRRVILPV